MEHITSRNNKTIIETTKLKEKKYRDSTGLYCFEGKKLFLEALSSNVKFVSLFVTEKSHNALIKHLDSIKCPIYTVSDTVYEKLTDDKAPDGVFCVARKEENRSGFTGKVFILSSLRDPGNLGTCIRTARAFGIDTLILHDCADLYNPKVIRSTMGGFFRQNILRTDDIFKTISELTERGYNVYPTALSNNSKPLGDINITSKTVFIIGNEGHGISPEVIDACRCSVIIPMPGDTESLNASVAATVLMWEMSKLNG